MVASRAKYDLEISGEAIVSKFNYVDGLRKTVNINRISFLGRDMKRPPLEYNPQNYPSIKFVVLYAGCFCLHRHYSMCPCSVQIY